VVGEQEEEFEKPLNTLKKTLRTQGRILAGYTEWIIEFQKEKKLLFSHFALARN
jgi:hypothetical protein